MAFFADLHIHSPYSRATSKDLTFENLYCWGVRKGLSLIGTGDCTHPAWLDAIAAALAQDDDGGLLRLRTETEIDRQIGYIPDSPRTVRFLITGEVCTIYKWGGATRKVHHVVALPDLDAARRFSVKLERIGNVRSDGRPILGLDSRDLLEILLETSPDTVLIPAHIWTPWFSVLGSRSGFNSIEECYRDLSAHIFAIETGLSSDPPMNWRVSALDRYTLVSNSDAHSPSNLGREACVFDCELSYLSVMNALRHGKAGGFDGTVEFFPQEGKYHADGHRACGIYLDPAGSRRLNGICPRCSRPLTLGVLYRVSELADRDDGARPAHAAAFRSVVSLDSIIAEILQCRPSSRKAVAEYDRLIARLGPELSILLKVPLEEIAGSGSPLLAEAIRRVRAGLVHTEPGYDGQYGIVKVFECNELASLRGELCFIAGCTQTETTSPPLDFQSAKTVENEQADRIDNMQNSLAAEQTAGMEENLLCSRPSLSFAQRQAVEAESIATLIIAGPGSGKTYTLTERIVSLVEHSGVEPTSILALTFCNRAARQMQERIDNALSRKKIAGRPLVTTFHRWGLQLLRENAAVLGLPSTVDVLSEEETTSLLAQQDAAKRRTEEHLRPEIDILSALDKIADGEISLWRITEIVGELFRTYQASKRAMGAVDFCDMLLLPLSLLAQNPHLCVSLSRRWTHILVDEYQDVNAMQYRLLRMVSRHGSCLFAIGDPDQAIYGFRGADVRYFQRFCADYPNAKVIVLDRCYRSSDAILRAAAAVLGNAALADKTILHSGIDGPRPIFATLPQERAEAEYVAATIDDLIGGTSHYALDTTRSAQRSAEINREADLSFGDIAVLFRTHAMGDLVEEALGRLGIPVQRPAQARGRTAEKFRAALSVLEYFRNPFTFRNAHKLLLAGIAGISPDRGAAIAVRLSDAFDGSLDALQWLRNSEKLTPGELTLLDSLTNAIGPVREALADNDLRRALSCAALAVGVEEKRLATHPWPLLLAHCSACSSLDEYLDSAVFDGDEDYYDPRAEGITLMTLHAAKGLEWRVVFIVGCEHGFIPLEHSADCNIDEERRLLYVGMTRAKQRLFLTCARQRRCHGEQQEREPSPFLAQIPSHLLERRQLKPFRKRRPRPDGVQLELFD